MSSAEELLPGWSVANVGGHPCDLFEPRQPGEHAQVVVYLHGVHLQRLVRNQAFTTEFERHGLRAIAPMTGRSWWANRISPNFDPKLTAERHVLDNVMGEVRERWQAGPPQVALLGTSMGGQGALRLSFKHPNIFPIVAAISPAIDYQYRVREGDEELYEMYGDEESARQDTATLHIHPLNWPRNMYFACDPIDYRWAESAERLRSKLYSLGIPHEVDLETTGGGHTFAYYDRMAPRAVGFIAERLERERLRVV